MNGGGAPHDATLYVLPPRLAIWRFSRPRRRNAQTCALIAAEDTRVTQKLLAAFDIHTPLTSCHEHNERFKAEQIVRRMLEESIDVALTTDAGTPCISDPGSLLTAEAIAGGIPVLAVPGPTALAAALSVSGFSVEEFTFYGFLPRNRGELREKHMSMAARAKMRDGCRVAPV
jgi:16S rRNA (cytidine1402-2'-O)-methyltransferase